MKIVLGLLLAMCLPCWAAVSFYPWGERDHKKRNEHLLSALKNNLGLETSEPSIIASFANASTAGVLLRGVAASWVARLATDDDDDSEDNETFTGEEDEELDPEAISNELRGVCSVLPIDYWNYEWCHKRELHQFHVQQKENGWFKDPSWSLGKYKRTVVVRDVNLNPSPITKLVDYYEGGQICHENNQKRSTEVHIQCCDGMSVPNYTPSDVYFGHGKNTPRGTKRTTPDLRHGHNVDKSGFESIDAAHTANKAIFYSISEPSTCSYVATICSPLLCGHAYRHAQQQKKGASQHTQSSLVPTEDVSHPPRFATIMQQLLKTCLMKQEEWWTYEYCIGTGVRQVRFDVETTTNPDGSIVQKSVPVNQYLLGTPSLDVLRDEEALVRRTKFQAQVQHMLQDQAALSADHNIIHSLGMIAPLFKAQENEVNFLTLEYTNGTPCDLDHVNRSSTVELYCGNRNEFRLIREESTCKYRIQVDLVELCSLPRFAPPQPQINKITVVPAEDFFHPPVNHAMDESVEDLGEAADDTASDGDVSDLVDAENEEMDTANEVRPPVDGDIPSDVEEVEGSFDAEDRMVDDHTLMEDGESEVHEAAILSGSSHDVASNEDEESVVVETQDIEENGAEGDPLDHEETPEGSDGQRNENLEVVVEVGI